MAVLTIIASILISLASITASSRDSPDSPDSLDSPDSRESASGELDTRSDIFCPQSKGDSEEYTADYDYGMNIYAQVSGSYEEDCYIRYSRVHDPDKETIVDDFIIPSYDIIVVSHGWQGAGPAEEGRNLHKTSDVWSEIVGGTCVPKANAQGIEPCEPTDHDSKYWSQNGYNVIFLDWRQFSREPEVKDAEYKLYNPVYNDQNVVELLYDKLVDLLDLVDWDGDEIRFVGSSLGAQTVLALGAHWKFYADEKYANALNRIAILDHFFSAGAKDYLKEDPYCVDNWYTAPFFRCKRYWPGEYARVKLIPLIRGGDNPAVIENYRMSPTTSNWFAGDINSELNKMTVFSELAPFYYGPRQLRDKHVAATPQYLHCMKFSEYGHLDNNAPNCRMDTEYMKDNYCPSDGTDKCSKRFIQKGDAGAYTTWDYDDKFDDYNVQWIDNLPFDFNSN